MPTGSQLWRTAVAALPPNAFAFVMATGIVSAALAASRVQVASVVLLWVGVTGLVVLIVVLIAHLTRHADAAARDARDPRRAFGYFTLVAGMGVVTTGLSGIAPAGLLVIVVAVAGVVWLVLAYALPANLILRPHEAPVSADIDGSWFLLVVSAQSLAIALATLRFGDVATVIAIGLWGTGIVLYLIFATLILLRLLTVRNTPDSFTPSYWIFTGATAISVLAATHISRIGSGLDLPLVMRPFIAGAAFVLWAFGTWWIPLLIIFGVWRHLIHHRPFRYEAGLWSIVFPLGTYATATIAVADVYTLPFLATVGTVVTGVATAAWAGTTVMMIRSAVGVMKKRRTV